MSVCDDCREGTVPEGCNKAHKTFRKTVRFSDGSIYEICGKIGKSFRIKEKAEVDDYAK